MAPLNAIEKNLTIEEDKFNEVNRAMDREMIVSNEHGGHINFENMRDDIGGAREGDPLDDDFQSERQETTHS
jgi:hypothetical protein